MKSKRVKFTFPLALFIFPIHQQNFSRGNYEEPQTQFLLSKPFHNTKPFPS